MIKKAVSLLLICLFALGLGFVALAEEKNDAMLDGYEDEFFDDDYKELNKESKTVSRPQQNWYQKMSFVPIAFGVLAGAAVVTVLYRRSLGGAPKAVPYELNAKVSVTEEIDRPGKVTHTSRRLTPPREQKND